MLLTQLLWLSCTKMGCQLLLKEADEHCLLGRSG